MPGRHHPPVVLSDEASWDGIKVTGSFAGQTAAHVDVAGCSLNGVALTGTEIDRLRLVDSVVEDSELSGAVLTRLSVVRVEFRRCRLSSLTATDATFKDVRFIDCKLDQANFRMTTWERSSLEGCILADADFGTANLEGTRLHTCDLTGADFSAARMDGVSLHGSTLERVRGGESFRGVHIGTDQVLPLAFSVFSALSIRIDDDPAPVA
jgi:uncharacterized protein YjbI with pentapeptide repeats